MLPLQYRIREYVWFLLACLSGLLALAVPPHAHAQEEFEPAFGRTMAWSAYNLGTTGYNQAVAIGKVLKDHYGVNLRVVPGKNDVSRLLPLVKGRVQFSANGIATYFAQEGVFQFAGRRWGPLKLRMVMMSYGDTNQAIGVAADTGITTLAGLRGARVPYVRGAPALNVTIAALLACADLTWDDVERVDFPGYVAMWNGVVNGQVDAAYANTVSGPTRKLEASPRGIFWPPAPHDDPACWSRMKKVVPFMVPHMATKGAAISAEQPHEGATYPYPLLVTLDSQEDQVVQDLAQAIHIHYDEYKDADPGGVGWAMDRQLFEWEVPYHTGAVAYFKKIGVWSEAADAHNARLIRRQDILHSAWQAYLANASDDFEAGWYQARAQALTAAGFDPVWVVPEGG